MYLIKKCDECPDMFSAEWEKAEVALIEKINWLEFSWKPTTSARIMHNGEALFVRMETDENPLLARRRIQNDEISDDSCMEFFLMPNAEDPRYLNFELNPFGAMYLGLRTDRYNNVYPEENAEFFNVKSYVDGEKWVLTFTIPFEFIRRMVGKIDDEFKGNIYKCGVDTVKEHYVTYYPIDTEEPDYHRPEFFGPFKLEK